MAGLSLTPLCLAAGLQAIFVGSAIETFLYIKTETDRQTLC